MPTSTRQRQQAMDPEELQARIQAALDINPNPPDLPHYDLNKDPMADAPGYHPTPQELGAANDLDGDTSSYADLLGGQDLNLKSESGKDLNLESESDKDLLDYAGLLGHAEINGNQPSDAFYADNSEHDDGAKSNFSEDRDAKEDLRGYADQQTDAYFADNQEHDGGAKISYNEDQGDKVDLSNIGFEAINGNPIGDDFNVSNEDEGTEAAE